MGADLAKGRFVYDLLNCVTRGISRHLATIVSIIPANNSHLCIVISSTCVIVIFIGYLVVGKHRTDYSHLWVAHLRCDNCQVTHS